MARKNSNKSKTQHVAYPSELWSQRRAEFGDRLPLMYQAMQSQVSHMDGYTETDRFAAREGMLAMVWSAYCLGAIDTWMRHLLQVMVEEARHTGKQAQDDLYALLGSFAKSRCCTVHQYVALHGANAAIINTFSKDMVLEMLASKKP